MNTEFPMDCSTSKTTASTTSATGNVSFYAIPSINDPEISYVTTNDVTAAQKQKSTPNAS